MSHHTGTVPLCSTSGSTSATLRTSMRDLLRRRSSCPARLVRDDGVGGAVVKALPADAEDREVDREGPGEREPRADDAEGPRQDGERRDQPPDGGGAPAGRGCTVLAPNPDAHRHRADRLTEPRDEHDL